VLILPVVWIVALCLSKLSAIGTWSTRNWVFLALSALASGISWVCAYKAIDMVGAARAGPIDKSSLAFTMVLAWMFVAGETVTPRLLLAGALVMAGALLSIWK
jgi:transporter family protein